MTAIWDSQCLSFSSFCDSVQESIFAWTFERPRSPESFQGHVRAAQINNLIYSDVGTSGITGSRDSRHVSSNRHYISLMFPVSGGFQLEQGMHSSAVTGKRIGICSTERPCYFSADRPFRHRSLNIPYDVAVTAIPSLEDWCGRTLDADSGLPLLLAGQIALLASALEGTGEADLIALEKLLLETVSAAITPRVEQNESWTAQRLRSRARKFILDHLEEPDLAPPIVADALGISVRYLHALFNGMDDTVGRFIRRSRLHAARAALISSSRRQHSITRVAMQYGFSDSSHFCRAFKAEFGLTPTAALRQ